MYRRIEIIAPLLLASLAISVAPRDARAALAHRYSFTTNANDSIGTAHGTVVDGGTVSAVFANGQLDLSANTGQGSNTAGLADAYVDLPNNLITDVANSGVSGAFSLEVWATVATTRTWQRYVDVGSANAGENMSDGGSMTPYIYIAANSGRFTNGIATEAHEPNGGAAIEVGQVGAPPTGVQQHVVGTYDQNDKSSGANGTFKLYRNGTLIGGQALPANLNLNTFTNNNNWLGRSQWNDPVFDGSYNEFRIYDNALTAADVANDTFLGPDVLTGKLPSLVVNKTTGAITIQNDTASTWEFYRISSAGSALNVAGWNSLDDQNYDAVDGADAGSTAGDSPGEGWDEAGGSNASQLVELFLGKNGSALATGETLNLGSAYNTSVFGAGNGDLVFTFGLLGGGQFTAPVTYVSGPAGVLGDYNNNGSVDAADYVVWRHGGPLQNESATPGQVTPEDYTFWRSRFGANSGSAAAVAAVPESVSSNILALLAAATLLGRGRRLVNCFSWSVTTLCVCG